MKVRLAPRAIADAKRMRKWWLRHRSKAPDLVDAEFEAAIAQIGIEPTLAAPFSQDAIEAEVRRVLMPKTLNHVYYVIEDGEVRVLAVAGAPRSRPPRL